MIFVGDVAIALGERFIFEKFPEAALNVPLSINLEGAIKDSQIDPEWGTYCTLKWIDSFGDFSLGPVFIGNNHIHDAEDGIENTQRILLENNLEVFGAGSTSEIAAGLVNVNYGIKNYLVLGFGWPVIGCHPARKDRPGVNRLEGNTVRRQAVEAVRKAGDSRVVVVMHGNYEFERYPQPGHRKLAFQLIDLGVYAVIFHHPHIVGPVERYKGRTIAYSLGNWAFSYGRFFGGKLRFPESSFPQIAVELGSDSDTVHHALFSPPSTVTYQFSEKVDSPEFSLKPEFEGFGHAEYIHWFKKNRVKRKLLPIYSDADASLGNWFRDRWVGVRQVLVDSAARRGMKAVRRDS